MIIREQKGFFAAFEGIDGCGKSTVLPRLAKRLRGGGRPVTCTHEPTDGQIGRRIYDILHGREAPIAPLALQKLYVEDRKEHIAAVLKPALARGDILLCDRYWLSTIAYGMLAEPMPALVELHQKILGADFLKPDMNFLLDLPAETAMARLGMIPRRLDAFERREELERIRENYLAVERAGLDSIVTIDARQEQGEIAEQVWKILMARIETPL